MEDFIKILSLPFVLLRQEFTVWGYTFSLWQIFILSCLAGIAGYIIKHIFE